MAAMEELQQRIEDWKGIRPGDLGEMILYKKLYATNKSKTYPVSCFGMKFFVASDVVAIVPRISFPEYASTLQRDS